MPRYWVEEWEVIKATSNVPRLLIQAVEAKSEDLARQIISTWFAGYAIAQGRENDGNTLLIRNVVSVWDSMDSALRTRFAAMALENEYPLDETDFFGGTPETTFLEIGERLIRKRTPKWLLGFRRIARATDERTGLFSALPNVGMGDSVFLMSVKVTAPAGCLIGSLSSFVFDYIVRQNIGGTNMSFFYVQQFAVLPPAHYRPQDMEFVHKRVLELAYTGRDICGFASGLNYYGAPFQWDDDRRYLLRCELDAFYFHLYGIVRDDVDYIMHTFPITRRKEEQQYGEYRTKRVILEIYDAMADAERTGIPYQTRLDPPPAGPRVADAAASAVQTTPIAIPVPMLVPSLKLVASGAWSMPTGVQPDNFVLLAISEVLHRFARPVDPYGVWMAVQFMGNPAMALAFLDKEDLRDWVRVIGPEAQPMPKNVIDISRFRRGATDQLWGKTVLYLKTINALDESSGLWSATSRTLTPADEEWLAGRAEIAVRLASRLVDEQQTELRLAEFQRSVDDGTAIRAVS